MVCKHFGDELPLVLSVEDLMEILGVGRNTAYNLVRSERIKCVRIGRQIRIPRAALLQFIEAPSKS